MKSYVLHRIKLIESFRMIWKSSKSTDENVLKNNLTSIYPLVKLNTQGHFLGKFVLWFHVCPRLACNCEWPAAIGILPTILVQKSEAGCQAWRQELEEKKFRLFNRVRIYPKWTYAQFLFISLMKDVENVTSGRNFGKFRRNIQFRGFVSGPAE